MGSPSIELLCTDGCGTRDVLEHYALTHERDKYGRDFYKTDNGVNIKDIWDRMCNQVIDAVECKLKELGLDYTRVNNGIDFKF